MYLVKIMLASFDYPVYTYDDHGMMTKGLPVPFEMTDEMKQLAEQIQSLYDPLFDTSGYCAKFIGFETEKDKETLLNMSKSLYEMIRSFLPDNIQIINTVPQTLFLAPLRETVQANEKEALEEKESFIGGGDCE